MRLTESVIAVWACLAQIRIAEAALSFTQWPSTINAGQPATVSWTSDSDAPVKLTLRKGAAQDLDTVKVLAPDATEGTYTWTPDDTVEDGSDYAFQIQQEGQVNYSGLIRASNPNPSRVADSSTSSISTTGASTSVATPGLVTTTQEEASQTQITPSATPTDTRPLDEMDSVSAGETGIDVPSEDNEEGHQTGQQSNLASSKSAMAAAMENGGPSFRLVSADLLLGAVAMVFYLAY
ncbi:hypothetical protein BO71DRAFT_102009 [Aspergillus ellipticus CBS 707.79]|uniref:Yeast cell wall synthesis Kre9/Knh1-like N-terminal domain-containing protein n=1 Tax=Aspergillus ellipticus CBS 707.79 TaxID=1448320 RepID=A0A319DUL8_9EURO|nr:hypothetical protein BO71DRAFT_102009 [Aspergillus ellipticus CBS 707.79]